MPSYGTVTFDTYIDERTGQRPNWVRKPNYQVRHISGSNKDDVQFDGLSNPTLTIRVRLTSDSGMAQLEAWQGDGIARTLTPFTGVTPVTNVYLVEVQDGKRVDWAADHDAILVFMRESA